MKHRRLLMLLLPALLAAAYGVHQQRAESPRTQIADAPAHAHLLDAFRNRRSNIQVQASGTVVKVLADDRDGSPHQRFIVRVSPQQTVLIAHNIALAPRVDGLRAGDEVEFNGEYQWNERGGVVHWTHTDPQRRHEAGWIRFRGTLYQ